jgi:MFS family permease
MQTVAAAGWLVYDLTGSGTAIGILTVLSRGPGTVLSTYGGELADRYDRRRLVIALMRVKPAALLAVVAWEQISRVTQVYVATLLIGVGGALASPARQQLMTATVPPDLAKRATGLASASYSPQSSAAPQLPN